jgi:hypothetical protein
VQPHDVLAQHALAYPLRHRLDEGFAREDAIDVAVVEYAAAFARQAQARAGDHDGAGSLRRCDRAWTLALIEGHSLVEKAREQTAEAFVVGLACAGG